MKFPKSIFLAFFLLGAVHAAAEETYPARPIRIFVGFVPGGGTDITARILAPRLSEKLGQPVIIENRPGAGGNLATEAVVKSAPDGYTLLMGTIAALAINPSLYKDLPFAPLKDLTPISLGVALANVVVVNSTLAARNLPELIALARQQPGKISYSTSGNGSAGHLAGALFESMANVRLLHVPYKGGAAAMNDLIGAQVNMSFATAPGAIPQIKAGKLRALAVTTRTRSVFLPDVPTVAETAGMDGYESSNWYGLVGPARLAKPVVDKLNAVMVDALNDPGIREKLALQGLEATPSSPAEFSEFLRAELVKWAKIVKDTGSRPD